MKVSRLPALLLLVAGLVASVALSASPAAAAVPPFDAFAVNATGTGLTRFSTAAPGVHGPGVPIAGLQAGEVLRGIDVRPATGQLYGLGSTSRVYLINPQTAAATAVGAPFTPALSGLFFGFDFNPTVDRIRVTSDTGQNLRLNPNTGQVAAVDTAPVGGVSGSAYTNSVGSATSTLLYVIKNDGTLAIQNPPNDGTLVPVGSLGLPGPILNAVGFDIVSYGSTNKAVASITTTAMSGFTFGLYEINLATGAATLLGSTGESFVGLALASPSGYCGADFDGQVACVGGAGGARPAIPGLAQDIVDAVQTPSGQGVWQVAFDGGVFASGDAGFFGSTGGIPLEAEIVGMAPTPTGLGYWFVGADGGVFNYGDAKFFGSVPGVLAPGQQLAQAVVGIVGTATGKGYFLVAEDGGIFAFGDALFAGSVPGALAPGQTLAEPVIGIARNEAGPGYYMVALDGGLFAFGGAPFYGSAGGAPLVAPVTDIAAAGPTGGYRLLAADGGIFNYGATFQGAIPGVEFAVGLAG